MKILNEENGKGQSNTFVLILDKREARTLTEIVEVACKADKKRSTFKRWKKKLDERLLCF